MSERLGQFFTPAKEEDKCDNRDRHDKCMVRNHMAYRLKRMKQRTAFDAAEQGAHGAAFRNTLERLHSRRAHQDVGTTNAPVALGFCGCC
jgi:hypothetical protein